LPVLLFSTLERQNDKKERHYACHVQACCYCASWTQVQFPFRVRSGRKLKLSHPVIVMVIGKAFFDIGHAPADHGNRRTDLPGYAAWEIHSVMKVEVTQ